MKDAMALLDSPEGAVVDVPILLAHASIEEPIAVVGVTFEEDVNLDGAELLGSVTFERCTFKKLVALRGVSAPDRISFIDCEFRSAFSLAAGTSRAGNEPVENTTLRHVKIQGCTFHGYTTFNNREFTRSPDFSDTRFFRPPQFQNVTMHPGVKLEGMSTPIPNTTDVKVLDEAIRAYRRLASMSRELGIPERYSEFNALELRTRMRSPRTSVTERALIAGYWAVSNFGRSISQPFIFLMIVSLALVAAALVVSGSADGDAWRASAALVINGALQPFSTVVPDFAVGQVLVRGREWADALLRGFGVLESFAALSALSLFLFALRRRFLP